MNRYNVLVIEHDGLDTRSFLLPLMTTEPISTDELRNRVIAACDDYVTTEEGKKILSYNCGCFNWADFEANVPNDICKKHGFTKDALRETNYEVDWDEQLLST
jgi:hypothetical protein